MSKDFIAELHEGEMDLSELYDKSFIVGVNTGERDKCKMLCSTIKGPYDFSNMVERVGKMYTEHQHHAKVIILTTNENELNQFLDEDTTDYLEAHWENIVFEATFESQLTNNKTMKAKILTGSDEDAEER